jgi:hypothetical protein
VNSRSFYRFDVSPRLVELALTHRSFAYEHGGLATPGLSTGFLGDSILGQAVTVMLYRDNPRSMTEETRQTAHQVCRGARWHFHARKWLARSGSAAIHSGRGEGTPPAAGTSRPSSPIPSGNRDRLTYPSMRAARPPPRSCCTLIRSH